MSELGFFLFFQAEDGIRDYKVTGVQTCALPILPVLKSNACMEQEAGMGKVGPFSPKISSVSEVHCGPPCQPDHWTGSAGSRPSGDTTRIRVRPFSLNFQLI